MLRAEETKNHSNLKKISVSFKLGSVFPVPGLLKIVLVLPRTWSGLIMKKEQQIVSWHLYLWIFQVIANPSQNLR